MIVLDASADVDESVLQLRNWLLFVKDINETSRKRPSLVYFVLMNKKDKLLEGVNYDFSKINAVCEVTLTKQANQIHVFWTSIHNRSNLEVFWIHKETMQAIVDEMDTSFFGAQNMIETSMASEEIKITAPVATKKKTKKCC